MTNRTKDVLEGIKDKYGDIFNQPAEKKICLCCVESHESTKIRDLGSITMLLCDECTEEIRKESELLKLQRN